MSWTFESYLQQTKQWLYQRRPDLQDLRISEEEKQKILRANLPFELIAENSEVGILLVHGLFDSTCIMQSLAKNFHQAGYWVRALLLPGSGTIPEDMQDVQYPQWLNLFQEAYQSFPASVKKIVTVGFSNGGLIVMHQTIAKSDARHVGVITLAPACFLSRWSESLLAISPLITLMNKVYPYYGQASEQDIASYHRYSVHAARQTFLLKKDWEKLVGENDFPLPIFMVVTLSDVVIDSARDAQYFRDHCRHEESRLLFYDRKITPENDPRIIARCNVFPDQQVIDFSHICLAVAPDHEYFGRQANEQALVLSNVGTNKELAYGEESRGNLRRYALKRLTYNPDFTFMMKAMLEFVERVV